MILSNFFVVKTPKIFDKIFFHSREKFRLLRQKKWSWKAKNTTLFFKNIGFELRFLWFCVAKPIILKSKTYAFGLQNDRFWKTKGLKILHTFWFLGYKVLRFRVLRLHTIFVVFSDKIFFCSEFSSFEAVNWGFLEEVCQKISKREPTPIPSRREGNFCIKLFSLLKRGS